MIHSLTGVRGALIAADTVSVVRIAKMLRPHQFCEATVKGLIAPSI